MKIYKGSVLRDGIRYIGRGRNWRRFNLGDEVFLVIPSSGDIVSGRIVGIELPPATNPEYYYKVEMPLEVVLERENGRAITEAGNYIELNCDGIFYTLDEARASAIERLDVEYKLQKEKIERYFDGRVQSNDKSSPLR